MATGSKGPLARIVLDEIALEGLEGITIPSLWVYLSAVLELPLPLGDNLKNQIWSFILTAERHLLFYELPVERPVVKLYNRFAILDPYLGVPIQPDECPMYRYKYVPVQDGDILGSCEYYKQRVQINHETLVGLTVDNVLQKWGHKFVIVGTQALRLNILKPANISLPKELSIQLYCVWELIGRARYNGETTSGSWSLQQFAKDATIVFYIKRKLISYGFVTQQTINEKRGDRVIDTYLLTLPRFYTLHKSAFYSVIEKLVQVLKETPKFRIEYSSARKYFPTIENRKSFKKITMTHVFRRIFEIVNINIMEAHDVMKVREHSNKERQVLVLKLKNPNISIQNDIYAENDATEKEETNIFYSDKHAFVDMSLMEEFYRCIERHGSVGCSQSDMSFYMGVPHITIRQLSKKALREGLITSYFKDFGRQRTNLYVAAQHSEVVKQNQDVSITFLKNMHCTEEPSLPDPSCDVILKDVPSISARIKVHEFVMASTSRKTTLRRVQRHGIVIKAINEHCILPFIKLSYFIQRSEREHGHKDAVCRKSIHRLLAELTERKLVQVYEIILQRDEHIRLFRYVTHPKITPDDKVFQDEVLRLKNNFFQALEERRVRDRLIVQKSAATSKRLTLKSENKEVTKELLPLAAYKSPKFLISRYLHEFLFYLRYLLNEQHKPIPVTENLLQLWQQAEPSLAISEYLETFKSDNEHSSIFAYTKDISWRTFIPPLPKYDQKPQGWLVLGDAVMDRMPLSIFNKIFRLDKYVDERIIEYLDHPVRQHYLLKELPNDMNSKISRARLQQIHIRNIKLLNNMGLVQVGPRENKDPLQLWIYLNHHGQILDTTPSEASYARVNPDRKYTTLNFEFKNAEDVLQYWTTLHRICVHTKLGFRKGKPNKKSGKNPEVVFMDAVPFVKAPENDKCPQVPGDRLGAGGLSTHLFAHAFRNWSWVVHADCKPKTSHKGRTMHTNEPKLQTYKRKVMTKSVAGGRLSVVPLKRLQVKGGGGGGPKRNTTTVTQKKHSIRDAVDRDALKNMRTLRVSWRKEEDELLKMARAVYLYLSPPVILFNLVVVGRICRDVMRHNLGVYNKTSQACLRRGQFIIKMNRHLPEVPTWLHLLQTNAHIQEQYGDNFIKHLKKAYPNKADLLNALSVHFMLILNFLYKLIKTNDIIERPKFLIPDTITEFNEKLRECVPILEEKSAQYWNPESEFELQMVIIINVLHSSLSCTRDKTSYSVQAFEIYKHFGEDVLREAFQKARSDGIVVAIKRKNLHVVPSQLAGPAYALSQKYRLRLTYLRIPYVVYEGFYAFFCTALKCLFCPKTSKSSNEQFVELKSPNVAQLFLISEGLANKRWQISVQFPTNILTLDADQREITSHTDRILDHFQCIFDNAPETEYIKHFSTEEDSRQVRIKFHPAFLSYKLHYSPYDIISKLHTRYLHFFCALDHMQQEVDINFGKLQQKDDEHNVLVIECPFNCIMKHANYINAIERIVQEKKSILNELKEMPAQQLLSNATNSGLVTVIPENLLTIVRMLESFWSEKELLFERKDLGKTSSSLKKNKTMNWQQLCRDILEYNASEELIHSDEFEPTLHKEERIVRANDVFVVNLPTLQLSVADELKNCADFMIHEGVTAPKCMLETDIQREAILQKIKNESYWKYTENTFETLRPILHKMNFSAMEIQHLEEIHNFIQFHHMGVSVTDLMREFPYDEFLLRALHSLAEHHLIKRVGVATFIYVHKLHMRPWVVHTFHIKRLEREGGANAVTLKRTLEKDDNFDEDDEVIPEKKNKEMQEPEEDPNKKSKRVTKPTKRYTGDADITAPKTECTKEVIVMKPQPWMRLNGSVNRRVLDRWIGCILTECISRSGCLLPEIFLKFPHMMPADIMFLLEILCDLKCIRLRQIKQVKVNLFSEYENIKESYVTELYNPEDTYVVAQSDALSRLAVFIGNKKYSAEFI